MNIERALFKHIKILTPFRTSGSTPHRLIHPVREWFVGLVCSIILTVGLFGYLGYEFYIQLHSLETPDVIGEDLPIYHVEGARNIVDTYKERKQEFERLRSAGRVSLPVSTAVSQAEQNTPAFSGTEMAPLADGGGAQYTDEADGIEESIPPQVEDTMSP